MLLRMHHEQIFCFGLPSLDCTAKILALVKVFVYNSSKSLPVERNSLRYKSKGHISSGKINLGLKLDANLALRRKRRLTCAF